MTKMTVSQFMHEMRTTSAILGRDTGVSVQFSGDQAYTDGKVINLPSMDVGADLTSQQVTLMRGYVDHEAGHHRHSDFPPIFDFYKKCQETNRGNLKEIHNCVEDSWMERKVMDFYPGSYRNLNHLNQVLRQTELESVAAGQLDISGVTPASAMMAINAGNPEYNTPETFSRAAFDMLDPKVQAHFQRWQEEIDKCEDSTDCIRLSKAIYKLLVDDPELNSRPEDFDPASGDDFDEGDPTDMEGEGDLKKECGQPNKDNPTGADGNGEGEGEGGEGPASASAEEILNKEAGDSSDTDDVGKGGLGGCSGDLVGAGYRAYTTEHDVIIKRGGSESQGGVVNLSQMAVNQTSPEKYESVKAGLRSEVQVMKSKLKRALMAKQQRDWDGGREDGRLDTKRLVKASQGVPTVFKRRIDREEEDTAISILVDLSGSMGGQKATVTRDCAVALAECFEGSNLKYKIVGFHNGRNAGGLGRGDVDGQYHRYESLVTTVFKDYDESLRAARGAVANIDEAVSGNNSDYDFVANEMAELRSRPEKRKVLFVLSDGHPACNSDAPTSEHVRLIRELINKSRDIESVGIGIQDDTVRQIYPDVVVVDNVSELATKVFHKLTQILIGGKR